MNLGSQHISNRNLSSDAIGMLILNELKCFRLDMIKEVQNLVKVMQTVTQPPIAKGNFHSEGAVYPDDAVENGTTHNLDNEHSESSLVNNFELSPKVKLESFKEISPESSNDILSNHIAFRMYNGYTVENEDATPSGNSYRHSAISYVGPDIPTTQSHRVFLPAPEEFKFEPPNCESINLSDAVEPVSYKKTKQLKYTMIYRCNMCEEDFISQSLYTEHFKDVHSGSDNSSTFAGGSLWDDNTFVSGVDQRQPKILYVCGVCSRKFSSRGSLMRHNALHSGVKRFICKICGKGFFRSDHLKSHLPTHNRQKSFFCHICEMYFLRAQILHKHMKLHETTLEENVGDSSYPEYEPATDSGTNMPIDMEEDEKVGQV